MIPISETIFWVLVHEVIIVLSMIPVNFRKYLLKNSLTFFNTKVRVVLDGGVEDD